MDKQETVLDILRFISMLFVIFKNGNRQKNCARYFKIRKYAFLIFEKGISKKTVTGNLRFLNFVSMLFLMFGKGVSKELCQLF